MKSPERASAMTGDDDSRPVVLINTFHPKTGKLEEFLSAQIGEVERMSEKAHAMGWRGNRIHVDRQAGTIIIVTSFASRRAKRAWHETEIFAEHIQRIAPLLDRVESVACEPVFAEGEI